MEVVTIPLCATGEVRLAEAAAWLGFLFAGDTSGFAGWVRERASVQNHPFETGIREADLEFVCETIRKRLAGPTAETR